MDTVRGPYQGITNIVRFNWHFYVSALAFVTALLMAALFVDALMFWFCLLLAMTILLSTLTSLGVSYYVYDRSALYDLPWLDRFQDRDAIVNIHAGFDETSATLQRNFAGGNLRVFDFYDPQKHTEVSIERARRAFPPFPGTVKVTTARLPLAANSVDIIFNIFALHEIRNRPERIHFLKEQAAALKAKGRIAVVEHLRDIANFLAYTIGFFHFFSKHEWQPIFSRRNSTLKSN
jgi:SAM-dependent methyltransferase